MKYLIMFLLISTFCNIIRAQDESELIDSLFSEIEKAKADTSKVSLYYQLAQEFRRSDPPKRLEFLEKGYELSKEIKWEKGKGMYHYYLGNYYGGIATFDLAITHFDSAIVYFEKIPLLDNLIQSYLFRGICHSHNKNFSFAYYDYISGLAYASELECSESKYLLTERIALMYGDIGQFDKALLKLDDCLQIAELMGDKRKVMLTKGNIGQMLMAKHNYEEGLKLLLESLEYFEETDDFSNLGALYNNIAIIYVQIEEYDKGLEYFKKAKKNCEQIGNIPCALSTQRNISQIYIKMGNPELALQELPNLIEKYREIGDSLGIAKIYLSRAEIYIAENDYHSSIEFLMSAKNKTRNIENLEFEILISEALGVSFLRLGNYSRALYYFDKYLSLSKSQNLTRSIAMGYNYKHKVFSELQDYKRALENYKNYKLYSDSLDLESQKSEIDQLVFQHETEKRINEINQLKVETELKDMIIVKSEQQKKLILLAFSLGLLGLLGSSFLLFKNRQTKSEKREWELGLKALRSQMNSHFIFNALASIYNFIESQNKGKAGEYLIKYSNLTRLFLKNSRREYSDLKSEIEILENYFMLEKARLQDSFNFSIEYNKDWDLENILIPSLLMQPLVENAIWHGIVNRKDQNGNIEVNFTQNNGMMEIAIKDNGFHTVEPQESGDPIRTKKKKSYGLELIQERLKIIGEKDRVQTDLQFNKLEPGFKVTIKVPFIED